MRVSHELGWAIVGCDWNCNWDQNSKVKVVKGHQLVSISRCVTECACVSVPVLITATWLGVNHTSIRSKAFFHCIPHKLHQLGILDNRVSAEHALVKASREIVSTFTSLHDEICTFFPVLWSIDYTTLSKNAGFDLDFLNHLVCLCLYLFEVLFESGDLFFRKDIFD